MAIDLSAIKSRLSDPREVVRLLGLKVLQAQRRGVMVACPAHRNRSGALSLRIGDDGTLQCVCYGCGLGKRFGGDILTLLEAIEGDFKRALARAQEMAGGAVGAAYKPEPEPAPLAPDVYHALASRIQEAGKLDGRPWVREIEEYLERRRLLELARADGWACLPWMKWLLDIARDICEHFDGSHVVPRASVAANAGAFAFSPHDLLIRADLAQYNQRGEFVPKFGRWRLVIPWRAPDGRITCLQRRRTWKHNGDGPEPAKYVFPSGIRPEWPYGADSLCIGYESRDRKGVGCGVSSSGYERLRNDAHRPVVGSQRAAATGHVGSLSVPNSRAFFPATLVAFVEGAVDVLAMRALHPSFVALGLPGIRGWRSSWAELVVGEFRVCLDRGKVDRRGLIPEDEAAARVALDCVGRGQETDRVLDWLHRRHREGRALFCALCGAPESWLCRGCGRRRAPDGVDWGKLWERSAR